ncbi:MAG: hypothetical protein ABIE74_07960 [Pseudomonadota bacterium]
MKRITRKQSDELWGEDGPYSQAQLIEEERILDDSISRVFVIVSVNINPFTFKYVKKHRKKFANNHIIQSLLDASKYQGTKDGYCCYVFHAEYVNEQVMQEARHYLKIARETIILMHKFVMKWLGLEVEKQDVNNVLQFKDLH